MVEPPPYLERSKCDCQYLHPDTSPYQPRFRAYEYQSDSYRYVKIREADKAKGIKRRPSDQYREAVWQRRRVENQ